MNDAELFLEIRPLLESNNEGIFWDFKKTLNDEAEIIKDILAFSNSSYNGDSYIIVGISESKNPRKILLSTYDRKRLNTDSKYLYSPDDWEIHGLNASEIEKIKIFSASMSEKISKSMLISQPICEYYMLQIEEKTWIYIIKIKKTPGIFISKNDLYGEYNKEKVVVKQGVLYVRIADTTIGAEPNVASATEHIRVWKNYFDWLNNEKIDS